MALEDRDWYRERPSDAWNASLGKGAPPDAGGGRRRLPSPATSDDALTGSDRRSLGRYSLLLPLVAAAWLAFDHREAVVDAVTGVVARIDAPSPLTSAAGPKVVRLGTVEGLDVPARAVTRWWLDDPRFGRISVHVPVGTTPREALTVALAERGYQAVR